MNDESEMRTAYLGRFGEFEVDIVMELLADAGITAFTKHPAGEPDHRQYGPGVDSDFGTVLVDATRVEEARRLVDEELPKHLESIAESMEAIDVGDDEDQTETP
jgi:hypothetical protein